MPLSFVDLFCGAGGFTQGLREAGLEHLGGVDLDKHACSTYAANHGAVLRADVRGLDAASILQLTRGRRPDLLAASPPCQSVSTVGRTPRARHVNDQLFSEAIRLAAELGCGAVIIENVAGFSSKLGEGGLTLADAAVRQLEVRAACRWAAAGQCRPPPTDAGGRLQCGSAHPGRGGPRGASAAAADDHPGSKSSAGLWVARACSRQAVLLPGLCPGRRGGARQHRGRLQPVHDAGESGLLPEAHEGEAWVHPVRGPGRSLQHVESGLPQEQRGKGASGPGRGRV